MRRPNQFQSITIAGIFHGEVLVPFDDSAKLIECEHVQIRIAVDIHEIGEVTLVEVSHCGTCTEVGQKCVPEKLETQIPAHRSVFIDFDSVACPEEKIGFSIAIEVAQKGKIRDACEKH